jgi:hypothetical protein
MRAVPPVDLRQSERIPATFPISLVVESEAFKVWRDWGGRQACVEQDDTAQRERR